ncbi:response regulator [Candidatus Parcubacteria bacterium]|nr:response regulator [Candidatus Parcubacteria bacterium]
MEIKGASILVVDDEELIIQVIVDVFTVFGVEHIFIASGADEAMDIIKKEKIDLIISDKDMPPGPSGIDLLKKVKQYYNHILFVLISAYDVKQEAQLAGADAFLQKPFTLLKLKEVVEKL